MFRLLLTLLPFLALQANPPAGDPPKDPPVDDPPPPADPAKPKIEWTAEQQEEIKRIATKEAKKAADKARQEEKDRIAAEIATAATEAQRKKDEEAGEFEKVRTGIEQERDGFKGERDTLKTENDALTAYFTGQYEAALKDLPDVITAFKPADDASFETKSTWLTTAQEQEKKIATSSPPGNRFNPERGGPQPLNIDQEAAKARASGRYRV